MRLNAGQFKEKEKHGLIDGKHNYLECSSCGAVLCDIWQVKKAQPTDPEFTFTCLCPYCSDRSFPVKIRGLCYPGGIGWSNPNVEGDEILKTRIINQEITNDEVIFQVIDVENGKPLMLKELEWKLS